MQPKIERGEIWWVNLDPTRGSEIRKQIRKQRPCVVVSADTINRWRLTAVVVPLSASPNDAVPVVIALPSVGPDSVAVVDQICAVDRGRFVSRRGRLSSIDLGALEDAIKWVLELP